MANILSAIIIAKHIIDNTTDLISRVQTDRKKLGNKTYVANDFGYDHLIVSKMPRVIRNLLSEQLNIIIKQPKFYSANIPPQNNQDGIAGMLIRKPDNEFAIIISGHETYCTQRFALCKELVQIYVDLESHDTSFKKPFDQLEEAVNELINRFHSSEQVDLFSDIKSAEFYAHAITLELLIPYKLRDNITTLLKQGESIDKIASMLFITKETLETYIDKYYYLTTDIYKILDQ